MDFSVLMSVYKNETPENFTVAMESVINQTAKPNEIVLIRDGQVPENLQAVIDGFLSNYPEIFTYIPLEENGGLGNALRLGLERCRNELVARMDTDDICVPDRFERQLQCFSDDPELDLVGGNIEEFLNSPDKVVSKRIVPFTDQEIKKTIKNRNSFNHMTVMFKKSSVLKAGNYQPFYLFEDWYLWLRLYLNGCKFKNLDCTLCKVRISGMAARRGGYKYFKSCKKLLKFMKKNKIIGLFSYIKSCTVRFCGYVLIPNKMRAWAYKKFLRKNVG